MRNAGTATARPTGLLHAVRLLALLLLLEIVLGAFMPRGHHAAMEAVLTAAATAIVVGCSLEARALGFREAFPLAPIRPGLYAPMALALVGLSPLFSAMANVVAAVLPPPRWFLEELRPGTGGVWGPILLVVLVAPVCEEIVFRGVILRGLLNRYTARPAIVVTALLFGAFHLNPWQFPGAVAFGLVAGWWFVATGSLLPCIFGHMLVNGLAALSLFGGPLADTTAVPPASASHLSLLVGIPAAICAGHGVRLLRRAFAPAAAPVAEPGEELVAAASATPRLRHRAQDWPHSGPSSARATMCVVPPPIEPVTSVAADRGSL